MNDLTKAVEQDAVEVARVAAEIVSVMVARPEEIGVKIAALRSAAEIMSNAVGMRALAAMYASNIRR